MSKKLNGENLKTALTQLAQPLAESQGVSLMEISLLPEKEGVVISVKLQKPHGINLGDCEQFAKAFGKILDKQDLIPENYSLEVASPGI